MLKNIFGQIKIISRDNLVLVNKIYKIIPNPDEKKKMKEKFCFLIIIINFRKLYILKSLKNKKINFALMLEKVEISLNKKKVNFV